jgi:hypothetical protein
MLTAMSQRTAPPSVALNLAVLREAQVIVITEPGRLQESVFAEHKRQLIWRPRRDARQVSQPIDIDVAPLHVEAVPLTVVAPYGSLRTTRNAR